ncbi:MAG: sigma 54-interacting transcriptional regulator, partial [Planctomycetaceae bacterium]|nr:sigma 54-interacting transcriptional regulator [Planctomycetaceae bacterium]
MKAEIVVISPSEFFAEKIRGILDHRGVAFPVFVATGEDTVGLAGRLIADGAKIIISRGRNVKLLRNHTTVAVVEVLYTYEDIYHSYQEARRHSAMVAFFGMDLAYGIGRTFRELSGMPLEIPEINDPAEIEPVLTTLIREKKIGCVIGGDTVKEMALKYGIKYVNTWVSPSSIDLAITEALGLLKVDRERRRNEWLVGSILDSSNNGTIAVDENNSLIYINHRARQLLKNREQEFLHYFLTDTTLSEAMQEHASIANHLIEFATATFSIDCSAIVLDDLFSGYAITIRDSQEISEAENEIRRKMARQFNVAKKTLNDISGESAAIRTVVAKARKYAASESTVLITGESGTGKEVFAQGIHNQSRRRDGPFVAINCAAIAENVLESELFGYVKGAFTGARVEGKAGVFEHAHTGTIFLDEIGEISKNMQVKLLRVLQEREIVRIGDIKNIPVDVRVIAATNLDLATLVAQNKFRMDLFYRLCVLELRIPSLRERESSPKCGVKYLQTIYTGM